MKAIALSFLVASFALFAPLEPAHSATRGCSNEGETFCITTESTILHTYDFTDGSSLYLFRTAYGNFFVYEGDLANVDSEHKVNMKKFPSGRKKAEYSIFYDGKFHQAYIRRVMKKGTEELHIWAEDPSAKKEDIEFILDNLRLL